ncbi:MAG: serine/threonine-protein kinase [Planctomycetota bacterium]
MSSSDPDPAPTPEELAAEYLARRELGESVDIEVELRRLSTEEERLAYLGLVADAERANRVLPRSLELGAVLRGRYELRRQLGEGGMGRVYVGLDRELGREVAVKVLKAEGRRAEERTELLRQETRLLAALQHPNIVAVHDSGVEQGYAWFVMDLVEGRALSDVIDLVRADVERTPSGRVSPRDGAQWARALARPDAPGRASLVDPTSWFRTVARIACELTRTIEAAHGAGVLHRDLKPANVLLTAGAQPVVLDFGLGGRADQELRDERLFGSVPYLAPEQIERATAGLDPRTDVYALGLILYELLALRRAIPGTEFEDVLARAKRGVLAAPSSSNPSVPRELDAICMLALEREPERRYASARALREDLEAYLSDVDVPVAMRGDRVRAFTRRARAFVRKHPVAIAAATLVCASFGSWAVFAGGPPLRVVQPVEFDRKAGRLRVIEDGDVVAAGGMLGVRVTSNEALYLYAFSMFVGPDGATRLRPNGLVALEDMASTNPRQLQEMRVGPCTDATGAACPVFFCAGVEASNRSEGLLVFASPGSNEDFPNWMDLLQRENPDGVELGAALDLFETLSNSRGGPVGEFTPAERKELAEKLKDASRAPSHEFTFPGVECLALLCRVRSD